MDESEDNHNKSILSDPSPKRRRIDISIHNDHYTEDTLDDIITRGMDNENMNGMIAEINQFCENQKNVMKMNYLKYLMVWMTENINQILKIRPGL